jgi:hypothetical protein
MPHVRKNDVTQIIESEFKRTVSVRQNCGLISSNCPRSISRTAATSGNDARQPIFQENIAGLGLVGLRGTVERSIFRIANAGIEFASRRYKTTSAPREVTTRRPKGHLLSTHLRHGLGDPPFVSLRQQPCANYRGP